MACKNGTCSSSNSCTCQSTSYVVPANAVYGDSTCRQPSEPCSEITCAECVRNCHSEDKWCVNMPVTISDTTTEVEFCIHKGERLDQMLQKLSLAQGSPESYPYTVKNFYVDHVTGGTSPTIKFIWYEFSTQVTGISMYFAAADSDEWFLIPWFQNNAMPLTANTATLDTTAIVIESGNTYKFKLVTSANGILYDPASVITYVTIP